MISPRVTVSEWESAGRAHDAEPPVAVLGSPLTVRAPRSAAGDFAGHIAESSLSGVSRNAHGSDGSSSSSGGRQGIAPGQRATGELGQSINQQAAKREVEEKNQGVQAWITRSRSASIDPHFVEKPAEKVELGDDNVSPREIPLGDQTVNRHIEGQMYYNAAGRGPVNETDIQIMRGTMPWETGLRMQPIQTERTVPETAQEAMIRLQKQQQFDSASIVSRAATWGTRRRSLPSVIDVEGVVSGNFLKKLSISGKDSHARRPSLISRIPSLVRKSSTNQRKRRPTTTTETSSDQTEQHYEPERRESKDSLAPPSRSPSWGFNRKPVPSLDTAILGMAAGAASIGSQHHTRTGSVSAASMSSPKSPFGGFSALGVPPIKNTLRRPRSKTELTTNSRGDAPSALVGLLKAQGGPPVAQLAKSRTKPEVDDDEDDADEDEDDDAQLQLDARVEIIPTLEGFKQHIVRLNPAMLSADGQVNDNSRYLVDRVAHSMMIRYKALCQLKVKHLATISTGKCQSGRMCIAQGGSAKILEARPDPRSDGDSPLDALSSENFPTGIPMPPTSSLPAEFECQLCFNSKKFTKPSDWTKHVHEDVAPFTCTWDRCRDTKLFKRKADWVRHENEGHRHLEWWTCDVEDCRHICYRRDNFLQHLVREHKFPEPKVKTKADVKRAGASDPTWSKVEQCHTETGVKPMEEPCRFCNKTFPTWKKLTVHLAKHMEHISLPVLKLVAAKDLDADTLISPVQDPPPVNFGSLNNAQPQVKQEPRGYDMSGQFVATTPGDLTYAQQHEFGIGMMPSTTYAQPMDSSYYADPGLGQQPGFMLNQVPHDMAQAQAPYQMAVTNGAHFDGTSSFVNMANPDMEAFPNFQTNSLGIQNAPGQALVYDGLMANPNVQTMHPSVPQYSHQGSASPYSRSPHQGPMQFYPQ
ncbi:uncharacterized protein B0I36DRAFT_323742 [Microdochium trichocladiopsis]|uniref:C2H2-type domain-containing protein n=1 Tax=Microdochium trichocladiopsis TaxID=1682393 RepID=A0A9P9BQW9_9PEZI|nr:uncharacterized protein B0I36DRAFT_323742 [Microdochium trichocladiopsis]KAH7031353.1 hypothetical protein B0I36DRAFT_323742 [Microdochium trichocladiopsis]